MRGGHSMRILLTAIIGLIALSSTAFAYDEIPSNGPIADIYAKAKAGNADAQFQIAETFRAGDEGVHKDMHEALRWYHKSATQGYVEAQLALGFIYRGGDEIQMSKTLSYMWFDIAYRNGNQAAYGLRNDVAWSMTQPEIEDGRRMSKAWKPNQKNDDGYESDEEDDN